MYISKFELINVRGFRKCEARLSKGINILIGPNNSGKTTLLRCLYTLQSTQALRAEDIRKTERFCKVFIEVEGIMASEKEMFYNHKIAQSVPADSDKQTILCEIGLAQEGVQVDSLFFNSNIPYKKDENGKISFIDNITAFNPFPKFPNSEISKNFIYPFFAKRKTNYYSSQAVSDKAYGVQEDMADLPSKILKIGAAAHPFFDQFRKHCNDILGFDISALPSDNAGETKIGVYVTNNHRIFLESMGEGVINILGLISILLTENNKLFLIEELENDIHPEALKKLLNLIIEKSKDNQFVISTHSNIVAKYLGSLSDTKLFHVKWKNHGETSHGPMKIPTSTITAIDNTPENRLQILESLGYEFFDVDLFSGYLIFEESTAEKIVRDFFIPTFTPLLYNRVRTIAAKGVNDLAPKFNDFHRLFLFLHLLPIYNKRVWVLADGDDEGVQTIQKLIKDFSNWPEEHFINFLQSDFEKYYPSEFQATVSEIFSIKNKILKREAKEKLFNEVMQWIFKDPEKAKQSFIKSAKEVIDILINIEKKLAPKLIDTPTIIA